MKPAVDVDRSMIEDAIEKLASQVKTGAGDTGNPWAMAHGLVAFGRDMKASDGRLVIDVIVSDYAEVQTTGGKKSIRFPVRTKNEQPADTHPNVLVKSLLEAEVPLDRKFKIARDKTVTLEELVLSASEHAKIPESDREWIHTAWTVTALLHAQAELKDRFPQKFLLTPFAAATLSHFEAQQTFLVELRDARRPDLVQKKKQFIYAHPCGGLHLAQAALESAHFLRESDPSAAGRAKDQIATLLFRFEAERKIYTDFIAAHPEHRRVLLIQEMKFYGHLLETLALAHRLEFFPATPENTSAVKTVTAELFRAVNGLAGDYAALETVRKENEQSYFDLIGDGCHAIRGLRETLVAFFGP